MAKHRRNRRILYCLGSPLYYCLSQLLLRFYKSSERVVYFSSPLYPTFPWWWKWRKSGKDQGLPSMAATQCYVIGGVNLGPLDEIARSCHPYMHTVVQMAKMRDQKREKILNPSHVSMKISTLTRSWEQGCSLSYASTYLTVSNFAVKVSSTLLSTLQYRFLEQWVFGSKISNDYEYYW